MKNKLFSRSVLTCWLLLFVSQFAFSQKMSFTIEGELKEIKSNARIWLGLIEPYELKGMAFKGEVVNGKFTIKGETYQPTIATLSLFLLDEKGKALKEFPFTPKLKFFLGGGTNHVSISDSFATIAVKNSVADDQINMEALDKKLAIYETELNDLNTMQFNAIRSGDTTTYFSTSKRIDKIYSEIKPIYSEFIKSNNSSYFSVALLMIIMHQFKTSENEALYNALSKEMQTSLIGQEILRQTERAKNPSVKLVGQNLQDAELRDMDGNKRKLSSYKGKYLLLEFWASWCGLCRKANPVMKALYDKYGNEKFEFVYISVDTDKTKWLNAIKDDGLQCPQLIDEVEEGKPGFYGKTFVAYRGDAVPLSFLINPEGKIVDVNPSKEVIEKTMKAVYAIK